MEVPTTPTMRTLKAARLFSQEAPRAPTKALSRRTRASVDKGGQLSWWDSAALGMVAGEGENSLRVLARGRNHGRQDVKDVQTWRDAEVAKFLATTPEAVPRLKIPMDTSTPVCYSPCHFARKYGKRDFLSPRVRLDPLPRTHDPVCCGTIVADGTPRTGGRENANVEARRLCWQSARAQMVRDVAMLGHDAAAAV